MTGGNVYDSTFNKKSKGWSLEGIERYNAIYQMVLQDRMVHQDFLLNCKKYYQPKLEEQKQKPKATKQTPTVMAAHDDFMDDEDQEEEDGVSRLDKNERDDDES